MADERKLHYVHGTVLGSTQTTQAVETFIQPGRLENLEWNGNFFSSVGFWVNWALVLKRDGTTIGTLIFPQTSGPFYTPAQNVAAYGNVVSDTNTNTNTNHVEGFWDGTMEFQKGDEFALVVHGSQSFLLNFIVSYHTTT